MNKRGKVIIRTDGNSLIGLGHIMRCIALMQILKKSYECEFWTRYPEYFPGEEVNQSALFQVLNKDTTLEEEAHFMASQVDGKSIIVLDGYQFTTSYQEVIKKRGLKLVCIDDIFNYHFVSDAVINHAGGVDPASYSHESYTKLLLGPAYALIKPLFYELPRPLRNMGNKKLLVSLGGADINNATDKIVEQLVHQSWFSEVNVIMGAANTYFDQLKKKYSKSRINFYRALPAHDIRTLMHLCPYSVLPPSTIFYEYLSIGGVTFLYQIADNQKHIYRHFIGNKIAFPFDKVGKITEEEFADSIQQQEKIFDGKSPERLLIFFDSLSNNN